MSLRIALIDATKAQIGQDSYLKSTMYDITQQGADCGFSGFTYYKDTGPFFNENRDMILEAARDYYNAQDVGLLNGLASMEYIKRYDASIDEIAQVIYSDETNIELDTYIRNAMAWFALELVSQHCIDTDDFQDFEQESD